MRKIIMLLPTLLVLLNTNLCLGQTDCVYIAGTYTDKDNKSYVAFWKSGQLTKLTNGVMGADAMTIGATSIEVIGSDVYVAGYKTSADGKNRMAAYWKNGREVPICLEEGYYWPEKSEAAVKKAGNDVYLFVTQPFPKSTAERGYYYYYKNGVLQKMKINQDNFKIWSQPYISNEAKLTFVTPNGDIYFAVSLISTIDNKAYVTYWKNGDIIYTKDSNKYGGSLSAGIKGIFVTDNGDVYIAGSKAKGNDPYNYTAVYWKNGKEVMLSSNDFDTQTHTTSTSIFVEGNNIYVSGEEWINSHPSAVYWKNGQKNYLNKYDAKIDRDAVTNAIAAVNGNVYTAGGVSTDLGYWVNNKLVKLNDKIDGRLPISMTVVKGGGCYNNTMSSSSTIIQGDTQQPFNNNITQGQKSLINGDYTGAMQNYANAATTATTKSDKELATSGVIISGLAGLADSWLKSSQARRERKQQQAEAELKKVEDDLKKAEDARKQKEEEQKTEEEKYKGWFVALTPLVIDRIKVKDSISIQLVIDRNIKAIGGLEKLKAVKSISKSTETRILPTDTYHKNTTVTAYGKLVSNTTYTFSFGKDSSKIVFNGITGYHERNLKKTNLDSASISTYKKIQPIDILMLQQNTNLELVENMVLFRGKKCYAIIERSKQSKYYNILNTHYFNSVSGLQEGVESLIMRSDNDSTTSYTFFDDYREVDGILFPFSRRAHIRYTSNSEYHYMLSGTTTTEIKINQPFTDKNF